MPDKSQLPRRLTFTSPLALLTWPRAPFLTSPRSYFLTLTSVSIITWTRRPAIIYKHIFVILNFLMMRFFLGPLAAGKEAIRGRRLGPWRRRHPWGHVCRGWTPRCTAPWTGAGDCCCSRAPQRSPRWSWTCSFSCNHTENRVSKDGTFHMKDIFPSIFVCNLVNVSHLLTLLFVANLNPRIRSMKIAKSARIVAMLFFIYINILSICKMKITDS